MQEKILALARTLSCAGEEELALLEALCQAAEAAWSRRLRKGVSPEACGEALPCAAAYTAAAHLAAGRNGGDVASFTAGDLSIKGRTGAESGAAAAALLQAAERLMLPYANPADFCFRGLRT